MFVCKASCSDLSQNWLEIEADQEVLKGCTASEWGPALKQGTFSGGRSDDHAYRVEYALKLPLVVWIRLKLLGKLSAHTYEILSIKYGLLRGTVANYLPVGPSSPSPGLWTSCCSTLSLPPQSPIPEWHSHRVQSSRLPVFSVLCGALGLEGLGCNMYVHIYTHTNICIYKAQNGDQYDFEV